MISEKLLEILRCPHYRVALHLADDELLGRINRQAAAGTLRNRAGDQLEGPLGAALVDEGQRLAYPIREGIPSLLADQAIELNQLPPTE